MSSELTEASWSEVAFGYVLLTRAVWLLAVVSLGLFQFIFEETLIMFDTGFHKFNTRASVVII